MMHVRDYSWGEDGNVGMAFLGEALVGFYITAIYPWIFTKVEDRISKKLSETI